MGAFYSEMSSGDSLSLLLHLMLHSINLQIRWNVPITPEINCLPQELSSRLPGDQIHGDCHRDLLHYRPHHTRPPDRVHLQTWLPLETAGNRYSGANTPAKPVLIYYLQRRKKRWNISRLTTRSFSLTFCLFTWPSSSCLAIRTMTYESDPSRHRKHSQLSPFRNFTTSSVTAAASSSPPFQTSQSSMSSWSPTMRAWSAWGSSMRSLLISMKFWRKTISGALKR